MSRLLPPLFAGARRGLFALLVFNGLAQVALALGVAMAAQQVIDRGLTLPAQLWPIALALLGAAAGIAWLRRREVIDAEALAQGYLYDVRLSLFDRLGSLPMRAMQRRSRGATALRFVGDLNALRLWISLGIARLLVGGLVVLLSLGALAFIEPMLAAAAGVVVTLGTAVTLMLGERLRSAARESRRRTAHLAANVNDKIAQVQVMQAFGRVGGEQKRLAKQCRRLREASIARARSRSLTRATAEGTVVLASAAVLVVGAWLIGSGAGTVGTLVAALSVAGILASPLRDLGRAFEYRQGATVSKQKLSEFLAEPARIIDAREPKSLAEGPGTVRFDGVSVRGALDGFSSRSDGARRVAIVGPNGAGKSTLLRLVLRLDEPSFGRILLDGVDLRDLSLDDLRAAVGIVGPDFGLLRMSVLDNVRYRAPNADDDDLARVLALTGLDELATQLPQGLETPVRDGGANLSPGQRARIAMARALLGRPRLLLLDEAEANLDPRASEALDRALKSFDGTVLMVTHRLDRLRLADHVWHLAEGRLVESGPPTELLQRIGPTSRLFLRATNEFPTPLRKS